MKRWIVRGVVLLLLVVLGVGTWAAVVFLDSTGEGSDSQLERWVRGQLLAVAGRHLRPTVDLGAFDYRYPDTIVLDGVTLSADGAADESAATDILHIKRVRLQLAQVPEVGKPLHIRKLILERPTLRAVAAEPGGVEFIGWSDLLRAPDAAAPQRETEQQPVRLSDVFRIELIRVDDASVEYDPRLPDTEAMRLEGITTVLRVAAEQGDWYGLQFEFDRPQFLSVKAEGRVDINALVLDVESAEVRTRLDRAAMSHLPPQLQEVIREYGLTGGLTLSGSGRIDANDPAGSTASGALKLRDAGMAYEKTRLAVDVFDADLELADRVLSVNKFNGQLLRGAISGDARLRFNDQRDAELSVELRELHLEDTIRSLGGDADQQPDYAGAVSGKARFAAPLDEVLTAASGGGEVRIREGRLGKLPVVSDLVQVVHGVAKATNVQALSKPSDTADLKFSFEGDRLRFSAIDVRTAVIAARGNGTLRFTGELDLLLNAGPLEKVQSLLGGVGDLLGKLTDQIAKYHVTGPVGDPKVQLKLGPG